MKKFVLVAIIIAMVENVNAQNVNVTVSGDAQLSTMNVSLTTGSVFDPATAFILHANAVVSYKKFGLMACYNGHVSLNGSETKITLADVIASYSISDEITVYFGPELVYTDLVSEEDQTGGGLIGMITWSHGGLTATGIVYANMQFTSRYLIGSLNYQITEKLSVYALGSLNNTEAGPFNWLVGGKLTPFENFKNFSVGAYYIDQPNLKGFAGNVTLAF